MKKIIKTNEFMSIVMVALLFLAAGALNPNFLRMNNIFQTVNGSVVYALVAIGMAFVIFIGEIDVSVGAILGISSAIAGKMVLSGFGFFSIVLVAILVGAFFGLINSIGVNALKVPSIIMTLGTNGIIRGLIYLYTGGKWIEGLDFTFKSLAQKSVGRTFSFFYLSVIFLTIVIHYFLTHSLFGKTFKAVGDSYDGAILLGLPVKRVRYLAFVFSGIAASVAGVLYTSRVGFVTPTAGIGYEMTAIAACVIGGIALSGGVGTIFGALIGSVLMSSISRILVFVGLPSTFDNSITGLMLIVIVVIGAIMRKRTLTRLRKERLSARIE